MTSNSLAKIVMSLEGGTTLEEENGLKQQLLCFWNTWLLFHITVDISLAFKKNTEKLRLMANGQVLMEIPLAPLTLVTW